MAKPQFQIDNTQPENERILLICPRSQRQNENDFQAALLEAEELVLAVQGQREKTIVCRLHNQHSAHFLGSGKVEEIAAEIHHLGIQLVIVNAELTPTQERNLEKAWQCRVLDRIGLILAIFALRAQTQEGKLQVELAQLEHLSARLIRGYGHLKSQKGGIGLKGPGETQLETDRRLIAQKINHLRQRITQVKQHRAVQRKKRQGMPVFALVGYTNVGKSTLFNQLTKSSVLAKDQLFATLDTTHRRIWLNEQTTVILTDTVGFIRDLPHRLIDAFSATLEETTQADFLLHVVDVSSKQWVIQVTDVETVLKEIGAAEKPQIMLYNKIDKLPEKIQPEIYRNFQGGIEAIRLSAKNPQSLALLREALAEIAS